MAPSSYRARPTPARHDRRARRARVSRVSCLLVPKSEQNAGLEQEAGLGRIGAARTKGEARCRAVRPDMGNLGTGKVDFVLVRRRQSNRPRVAAGAVKEI